MAGEFFVMETLYRLGYQPALTMANAKKIDILLAVSTSRTIRISVKTVRGGGKWPVGNSDWKKEQDMFFIFLYYCDFGNVATRPEVFIVPAPDVQKLKESWFDSFALYFSNQERLERLEPYRDAWHLIKGKWK